MTPSRRSINVLWRTTRESAEASAWWTANGPAASSAFNDELRLAAIGSVAAKAVLLLSSIKISHNKTPAVAESFMNVSSHAERVFRALIKNRLINRPVLRALRKANKLLGLAIGWRVAELRDSDDPLLACYSKVEEHALHATLFREVADILAARLSRQC